MPGRRPPQRQPWVRWACSTDAAGPASAKVAHPSSPPSPSVFRSRLTLSRLLRQHFGALRPTQACECPTWWAPHCPPPPVSPARRPSDARPPHVPSRSPCPGGGGVPTLKFLFTFCSKSAMSAQAACCSANASVLPPASSVERGRHNSRRRRGLPQRRTQQGHDGPGLATSSGAASIKVCRRQLCDDPALL
jgi:hypothetical protein